MEAKLGQVRVYVVPCKLYKYTQVAVSFKAPGVCSCCLKQLQCGIDCSTGQMMEGLEEAAMAYALYLQIENKFVGSAALSADSKVGGLGMYLAGDNIVFRFTCPGNYSGLRKSLGNLFAKFSLNSIKSIYANNIRRLTGKASVDASKFDHCFKLLANGLDGGIHVVAVGPLKEANLKDILSPAINKLSIPKASVVTARSSVEDSKYPFIECKPLESVFYADLLKSVLKCHIRVLKNGIIVEHHKWNSSKADLRGNVKDYMQTKYKKFIKSGTVAGVIIMHAIESGHADAHTLMSIKPSMTMADLLKLI
jgi:hypothetical protein